MASSPPQSRRLHDVSAGDSIVVFVDKKWRPAEVVAIEGDYKCQVRFEGGVDLEWVSLDTVKYMAKRLSGVCSKRKKAARPNGESRKDAEKDVNSEVEEEEASRTTTSRGRQLLSGSRETESQLCNIRRNTHSNSVHNLPEDNNSGNIRRSKRLQERPTSQFPSGSKSFDGEEFMENSTYNSLSSCSDSSSDNEVSSSDTEFSEASSNSAGCSSSSMSHILSPKRRSLRVYSRVAKKPGTKEMNRPSVQSNSPCVKKIKSCHAKQAEHDTSYSVSEDTDNPSDPHQLPAVKLKNGILCSVCQCDTNADIILRCVGTGCLRVFHDFCLLPSLRSSEDNWHCPYCSKFEGDITKRVQKIVGARCASLEGKADNPPDQFLIKWESLSHHHDSWVPRHWLWAAHRNKLLNYQKKLYTLMATTELDERKPEWFLVDRVVACRRRGSPRLSVDICSHNPNDDFEYLVKWKGLDYCDATWEPLTDMLAVDVDRCFQRHQRASERTIISDMKSFFCHFDEAPGYLNGALYDYQLVGLNWMLSKFVDKKNVILADEMGLGKTVQVVCFIQSMNQENLSRHPVLIIAPKSVLFHWEKEFSKWASNLNVITYQGGRESRKLIKRYELYSSGGMLLFDALITNYELALLDSSILRKVRWSAIIIDEGHKIKNLRCKLSRCLRSYNSDFRLLLTGTPLQNTLLELFALLHFLDPGEFSDPNAEADSFLKSGSGRLFEEKLKIAELHEILKLRMLRRMKSDVLPVSIPAKRWVEVPCSLTDVQRDLYINLLEENYVKLNEGIQSGRKLILSNILMQLRKCCNHPYLFPGQEHCYQSKQEVLDALVLSSGKLQLLQKLLPGLKEKGNRVLLFSQFTSMLDILEDFLAFLGVTYYRIDGKTSIQLRQQQMKQFNDPDSQVFLFLISTRAGGLGIDLPTADRVIIYDPDFNPFMDLQAQSRAHRIGQTKPVVVYQLITKCTVEEKILQKSKKKLAIENLVMNRNWKPTAEELQCVLLHGAGTILSRKNKNATTIQYDDCAIEDLLNIVPAPGEKCASEENGYLGSIESFTGVDMDQPVSPSPKAELEEILGPVKADKMDHDLGRGKRKKPAVKYYASDDDAEDDDNYTPESSSQSSSDDESESHGLELGASMPISLADDES